LIDGRHGSYVDAHFESCRGHDRETTALAKIFFKLLAILLPHAPMVRPEAIG
jgi:hypothetical protein